MCGIVHRAERGIVNHKCFLPFLSLKLGVTCLQWHPHKKKTDSRINFETNFISCLDYMLENYPYASMHVHLQQTCTKYVFICVASKTSINICVYICRNHASYKDNDGNRNDDTFAWMHFKMRILTAAFCQTGISFATKNSCHPHCTDFRNESLT